MTTSPSNPKPGSIEADGLELFLDNNYMYRGNRRLGGYKQYIKMVDAGMSDEEIGEYFGRRRQTTHYWRTVLKSERQQAKEEAATDV